MISSPYHKHWVMPTKTNPSYFLSQRSINTLKPAPLKKHSKFNFHSNMVDSNLSLAINVCSDVDAYPIQTGLTTGCGTIKIIIRLK